MPGNVVAYEACCHCGAIGFVFHTFVPPEHRTVRACQCGFCRSQGACTTSDPRGFVEFRISDPATLQRHRFGTRSTDFLVCRRCGAYLAATIETASGRFATLNVNMIHPSPGAPEAAAISYDGESAGARQVRRERLWTPVRGTL